MLIMVLTFCNFSNKSTVEGGVHADNSSEGPYTPVKYHLNAAISHPQYPMFTGNNIDETMTVPKKPVISEHFSAIFDITYPRSKDVNLKDQGSKDVKSRNQKSDSILIENKNNQEGHIVFIHKDISIYTRNGVEIAWKNNYRYHVPSTCEVNNIVMRHVPYWNFEQAYYYGLTDYEGVQVETWNDVYLNLFFKHVIKITVLLKRDNKDEITILAWYTPEVPVERTFCRVSKWSNTPQPDATFKPPRRFVSLCEPLDYVLKAFDMNPYWIVPGASHCDS